MCRDPPPPATEAPRSNSQEEPGVDGATEPQATEVIEATILSQSGGQADESATSHPPEPAQPVAIALIGEEPHETMVEIGDNSPSSAAGDTTIPLEIEETPMEQEPPSVMEPPRTARLKSVVEKGCSKDQHIEETTLTDEIEHTPRVPPSLGYQVLEKMARNFCIGSYDPLADPKPQAFDHVLDTSEDDEFIERGLYHTERTISYLNVCNSTQNLYNVQ